MIFTFFFIQRLESQSILIQLEVCQDMKSLQQMSLCRFLWSNWDYLVILVATPGPPYLDWLYISWLVTFSGGENPPFHQLVGKYSIFIIMTFSNHLTVVFVDVFWYFYFCRYFFNTIYIYLAPNWFFLVDWLMDLPFSGSNLPKLWGLI